MPPAVLALFAHPDDAEFLSGGTLAHLSRSGAHIHIATMTAGDCGSAILPPEKIARIRRKEAERAAARVGAEYSCLGLKDLLLMYDGPTLKKVFELLRRANPDMVITHSPSDYMVDHETTSRLVQTACFGAMAPNFRTGARDAAPATRVIPHLYYVQPFGGRDILGDEVRPRLVVDISATLDEKKALVACHESQRAWLRSQQDVEQMSEPVEIMARRVGALAGLDAGEGFRQHLGQGFPQSDPLRAYLGGLVRTVEA
ncbi:MAG: PIG-L family deacetylase [Acidobacteria bacterium]|nr:PIG-L family deacetylase [Acidobacteriota bacterium]